MIRIVGVQRPENADLVNVAAQMRQQLADRHAALTPRREFKRRGEQTSGGSFRSQVGGGRSLAFVFSESWFGVEEVALKRATIHKQMNDSLGPRSKVSLRRRTCFAFQQTGQRQSAQSTAQGA